jgi:hypothetical protein
MSSRRSSDRVLQRRQRLEDVALAPPALGMPAAEATSLMTRRQWREGDVARLEAAAARLGVQVPPMTEAEARLRSG